MAEFLGCFFPSLDTSSTMQACTCLSFNVTTNIQNVGRNKCGMLVWGIALKYPPKKTVN